MYAPRALLSPELAARIDDAMFAKREVTFRSNENENLLHTHTHTPTANISSYFHVSRPTESRLSFAYVALYIRLIAHKLQRQTDIHQAESVESSMAADPPRCVFRAAKVAR